MHKECFGDELFDPKATYEDARFNVYNYCETPSKTGTHRIDKRFISLVKNKSPFSCPNYGQLYCLLLPTCCDFASCCHTCHNTITGH